jgi:hypothetical protein
MTMSEKYQIEAQILIRVIDYSNSPVSKLTEDHIIKLDNIYVRAENTVITVEDCNIVVIKRNDLAIINNSINTLIVSLSLNCKERSVAFFLGGLGEIGRRNCRPADANFNSAVHEIKLPIPTSNIPGKNL